jgi:hypothetical protein
MQWYVYLITIAATAVLGWFGYELLGRPIRVFLALRRKVLRQMLVLQNIPLPRPRELAISSLEIRAYDQAVADVRAAQRIFRNLGFQLLAFGENELVARNALGMLGLNIVAAGSELIKLSDAYPRYHTDRARLQNPVKACNVRTRSNFGTDRFSLATLAYRKTIDAARKPSLHRSP